MEAIHLAQEAIITEQREEIEELKKTLETYRNKYYDNHDTILKLKTRIYYLGEMLEHYTERKNYGKN